MRQEESRASPALVVFVSVGMALTLLVGSVSFHHGGPADGTGSLKERAAEPKASEEIAAQKDICQYEGARLFHAGRLEEAVTSLNDCISSGLVTDMAYYMRGRARILLGFYAEAVSDLTQALSLNPSNTRALLQRAVAYGEAGELDSAKADFAVVLKPPTGAYLQAQALQARGKLLMKAGDEKAAWEDFKQAQQMYGRVFGYGAILASAESMKIQGIITTALIALILLGRLTITPPRK